jgi:hypothetical protein
VLGYKDVTISGLDKKLVQYLMFEKPRGIDGCMNHEREQNYDVLGFP